MHRPCMTPYSIVEQLSIHAMVHALNMFPLVGTLNRRRYRHPSATPPPARRFTLADKHSV